MKTEAQNTLINEIIDNYSQATKLIVKDWKNVQYLSDELKNNKELALFVVKENPEALHYFAPSVSEDIDILVEVFKQTYDLQYIKKEYLDDTEYVIKLLSIEVKLKEIIELLNSEQLKKHTPKIYVFLRDGIHTISSSELIHPFLELMLSDPFTQGMQIANEKIEYHRSSFPVYEFNGSQLYNLLLLLNPKYYKELLFLDLQMLKFDCVDCFKTLYKHQFFDDTELREFTVKAIEENCNKILNYLLEINKAESLELPLDNIEFVNLNEPIEFDYHLISNEEIEIIGTQTKRRLTHLLIPSMYDGYKVVSIGPHAFEDKKVLDLTLPTTIRNIKKAAFKNNIIQELDLSNLDYLSKIDQESFSNNEIRRLTLPKGIVLIDNEAFYGNRITKLDLSYLTNLRIIGEEAFLLSRIRQLTLPASIAEIKYSAFKFCHIKHLDLSNCINLTIIGSSAFSRNKIKTLKLPYSLSVLGSYCFVNNELTKIDINHLNNLKILGRYAFSNNHLTKIELPVHLVVLNEFVFSENHIQELDLTYLKNLIKIETGVFAHNRLELIRLPEKTQIIGEAAFATERTTKRKKTPVINLDLSSLLELKEIQTLAFYNSRIKEVQFPDNLARIGESAFESNGIKDITWPRHLEYLETNAFKDNRIRDINLTHNKVLKNIGDGCFSENRIRSYHFPPHLSIDPKMMFELVDD